MAGEKAFTQTGEWLPAESLDIAKEYLVSIKGPLTTPTGGGIRSLNVAMRQTLDLYVCLRPVRWFTGVPSPVKHPEWVDMVIFRENTEDIYAGIEYKAGTPEAEKFRKFLIEEMGLPRSASRKVLLSVLNLYPAKARNAWYAPLLNLPWSRNARPLRSYTKATS